MSSKNVTRPLTDELLVAYLDNELDAEQRQQLEQQITDDPMLAERLAMLDQASLPFKAAYETLLTQAPQARLLARLDNLSKQPPAKKPLSMGRRDVIAAGLACLALGVIGGRLSLRWDNGRAHEDNWRDLVAEYMSLYTGDTFANLDDNPALQQQQINTVALKLGLTLNPEQLRLPGATLKFARVLSYDRQPIAQIAYLDEKYGPLAFCITRAKIPRNSAPENEVLKGMNVVYWSADGHRFMLIGRNPPTELRAMAQKLSIA
jgi:anti-sigma factor RsiW